MQVDMFLEVEEAGPTPAQRGALAAAVVGGVLLLVALAAPGALTSALSPWGAILATFGLSSAGLATFFYLSYAGTEPGIKHDGVFHSSVMNRGLWGWVAGVGITTFYVLLYWHPGPLEGAIRLLDPLSYALAGTQADQWFLYGFLYTASVIVFGGRMAMKYRHKRYHLIRTGSVVFFQLGFAFLLPNLLKGLHQPDFYFTYFWPLKPDYLLPFDYVYGPDGTWGKTWNGVSVGRFMLLWGAAMTFVVTPVLTYFYGKRWYCSWVCGCGGLAETLGDPWRQLSDKSEAAWRFERYSIHAVLLFVVGITGLLWVNEAMGRSLIGDDGSNLFWKTYGFLIVMAFSGVIGVGFYPLMGSRVWCRFGCPMAAILGLQQRFFSRFRITTNGGQCISCGNCSTYCEMGIDVRAYAQRGDNIVRASCVGCGVCAAVCPRGVLKLENGPVGDRFELADDPIAALNASLKYR
jgi:Pyruvate/2-oxoacid:ferredoxin oxidoreductase delta subunit